MLWQGFVVKYTWVQILVCHLQVLRSWLCYLVVLSLIFLFHKMETNQCSLKALCEDFERCCLYKYPKTRPGKAAEIVAMTMTPRCWGSWPRTDTSRIGGLVWHGGFGPVEQFQCECTSPRGLVDSSGHRDIQKDSEPKKRRAMGIPWQWWGLILNPLTYYLETSKIMAGRGFLQWVESEKYCSLLLLLLHFKIVLCSPWITNRWGNRGPPRWNYLLKMI